MSSAPPVPPPPAPDLSLLALASTAAARESVARLLVRPRRPQD